MKRIISAAAIAAVSIVLFAACGHTTHTSATAAASSRFASAAANATVSTDVTTLENKLLAAYKADFSPAHPFRTMKAAIHSVFPHGDTSRIAAYAVQHLTPAMAHSKTARSNWAQLVVTFALGQGAGPGATPSASPAASASQP